MLFQGLIAATNSRKYVFAYVNVAIMTVLQLTGHLSVIYASALATLTAFLLGAHSVSDLAQGKADPSLPPKGTL